MLSRPEKKTPLKRHIVDQERLLITQKLAEIARQKKKPKTTPEGVVIPNTARNEYLYKDEPRQLFWDDELLTEWVNEQGPFFNSKGELVTIPLNVHQVMGHRQRTIGKMYKPGSAKRRPTKSPLKAAILKQIDDMREEFIGFTHSATANTNALAGALAKRDAEILHTREVLRELTLKYNKLVETLALNRTADVRHLKIEAPQVRP